MHQPRAAFTWYWREAIGRRQLYTSLFAFMLKCGPVQANYNVVIPTVTRLCDHIGVSNSAVGLIIGCCDIATVMSTMGTPPSVTAARQGTSAGQDDHAD